MNYVRGGDTLVITRLDRLARSTVDLCNIAAELEKKKVALQVIDQNIDTNDAFEKITWTFFSEVPKGSLNVSFTRPNVW